MIWHKNIACCSGIYSRWFSLCTKETIMMRIVILLLEDRHYSGDRTEWITFKCTLGSRGESNHGLLGARWGIKRRPNKVDPGNGQKPGQGNTSVWLKCVIIAAFQIMVNCLEPHHHHPEEQNQNWHLRKPRALQSCLWTEILDGRPWIQWTFWSSVHLGKK